MGFSDLKNVLKKIDKSLKDKHKEKQQSGNEEQQNLAKPSNNSEPAPQQDTNFNGSDNIFGTPIATSEPPDCFKRVDHAQKPEGCDFNDNSEPIQTNNFYNNLTLDDQTFPIWTLPYSLWLTKDPGQDSGMAFNHTDANQKVYGPEPDANPAQFYFNPPKIKSFVISGVGFTPENVELRLSDHNKLSVTGKLQTKDSGQNHIRLPLVQGMGFITAEYKGIQPVIASQVGFQLFQKKLDKNGVVKYKALLFNQIVWSVYVTGDTSVNLELKDPNHIVGNKQGNGTVIQIARGESKHYDSTSGAYPTACHISGLVNLNDKKRCQYKLSYDIQGKSENGTTLLWCLPHQYEVLAASISSRKTDLELDSPTKGVMKAFKTNEFAMEESDLPVDISWEPWSSLKSFSGKASYSENALSLIKQAAEKDVQQDVVGMANIDSMYTSGKILDKFAYITYVCHFILKDKKLTDTILPKIKQAIEIFSHNKQIFPLVYDKSWKGLISSAEPGADFGNSNYNDHHFHYGYHIHAIALVAKVDEDLGGNWLHDSNNNVLNYAITLVRDIANPSRQDKYFPESRAFDWFHGHSFAHGIFPSGDGKDEESSSEDYHFAHGMKLFAIVTKDADMEARANLMLAIMKRSMNKYMLFKDDNKIQPKNFIKNKVAGITFENKLDYATYFGRGQIGDEWIHGIHMIPITPISSYIRDEEFVKEEWDQKLASLIDHITDGWKGILMLNYALHDPRKAWDWFSSNDDPALIDNGMSRTWTLAYIAGVGGAN